MKSITAIILSIAFLSLGIFIGYTVAVGKLFIEIKEEIDTLESEPPLTVRAIAGQTYWKFHYPVVRGQSKTNDITELKSCK